MMDDESWMMDEAIYICIKCNEKDKTKKYKHNKNNYKHHTIHFYICKESVGV